MKRYVRSQNFDVYSLSLQLAGDIVLTPHQHNHEEMISVIIRFHDIQKLDYLDECLFSLAGQKYKNIEAIVVTQNFKDADFKAAEAIKHFYDWQISSIKFVNVLSDVKKDMRSKLINEGIKISSGRYLAFLDFDDTVYANIYTLLIEKIRDTQCSIALAGTNRVDFFLSGGIRHKKTKTKLFGVSPKLAFFVENQYPIHSYVLDMWSISKEHLCFDVEQSRNEDYAFLLSILANYPSDDSLISTPVCDYYINVDGGNTIMAYGASASDRAKWAKAEEYVTRVKQSLVIKTSYSDIKNLHDWSSHRDVNSNIHQTIFVLEEKIRNLEDNARIASRARSVLEDDLKRWAKKDIDIKIKMGELLSRRSDCLEEGSLTIDIVETMNGRRIVSGWCKGLMNTAPLFIIFYPFDKPHDFMNVEVVERQDVADAISSKGLLFGFKEIIDSTGEYVAKFIAEDGNFYEVKFSV